MKPLFTSSFGLLALAATQVSLAQTRIAWQGYRWFVKSGVLAGPGPNTWSPQNIWVDAQGFLHLKIAKIDGKWSCAEIWSEEALPFGTYQCQVEGALDTFDPNVIFSMFSYQGPDGTKEIDIEYAKWGNSTAQNAWWTVYPNNTIGSKKTTGFTFSLKGTYTTSRFTWSKVGVDYALLGGHQAIGSHRNLMQSWNYRPTDPVNQIPQNRMSLHFNLWLFQGKPPTDDKPVEVILHGFDKK